MLKKISLCCCLALIVTTFGNVAFAMKPYASIIAYNQNVSNNGANQGTGKPNMTTMSNLNIINMTPWDISFGQYSGQQNIFSTMTTTMTNSGATTGQINAFWLAGFNTEASSNNMAVNFAYHSVQIPLLNGAGNVWLTPKSPNATNIPGYTQYQGTKYPSYTTTFTNDTDTISVPIIVNSNNFQTGATPNASLNFLVTASSGFSTYVNGPNSNVQPVTALTFGDGTNNYGFTYNGTMVQVKQEGYNDAYTPNVTNFLSIQAADNSSWVPITPKLAATTTNSNSGVNIPSPQYLNVSGMALKNFASYTNSSTNASMSYDLVVILQSGDYADCSLLFLAVPSSNNGFLPGVSGGRR